VAVVDRLEAVEVAHDQTDAGLSHPIGDQVAGRGLQRVAVQQPGKGVGPGLQPELLIQHGPLTLEGELALLAAAQHLHGIEQCHHRGPSPRGADGLGQIAVGQSHDLPPGGQQRYHHAPPDDRRGQAGRREGHGDERCHGHQQAAGTIAALSGPFHPDLQRHITQGIRGGHHVAEVALRGGGASGGGGGGADDRGGGRGVQALTGGIHARVIDGWVDAEVDAAHVLRQAHTFLRRLAHGGQSCGVAARPADERRGLQPPHVRARGPRGGGGQVVQPS